VFRLLGEPARIVTPTIVLYEVYKVLRRDESEEHAVRAVAQMMKTNVVPLTATIALEAADLALEHGLATADAIIYATGRDQGAEVVTTDADLGRLPGMLFFSKKRR
jgi:predicted nucleic acid-binding protein